MSLTLRRAERQLPLAPIGKPPLSAQIHFRPRTHSKSPDSPGTSSQGYGLCPLSFLPSCLKSSSQSSSTYPDRLPGPLGRRKRTVSANAILGTIKRLDPLNNSLRGSITAIGTPAMSVSRATWESDPVGHYAVAIKISHVLVERIGREKVLSREMSLSTMFLVSWWILDPGAE